MIASEEYPRFREISTNENFTEFTVILSSENLETSDSYSTMTFFMYGKLYGAFSGEDTESVHVEYVSQDSGQVIRAFDSSDVQE